MNYEYEDFEMFEPAEEESKPIILPTEEADDSDDEGGNHSMLILNGLNSQILTATEIMTNILALQHRRRAFVHQA